MVGRYPARSEFKVVRGVMVLGMRREGIDSEYTVTSSSSYSSSSEVKAGIRKFGGFLEMASARALRLHSVASRVFRIEVGTEIRTGTIPNTRVRTRGMEVRSLCGSEVCRMRRIELS